MALWRDDLSRTNAQTLAAITENIRGLLAKSMESLYLVGCELRRAKALLGIEDSWIAWLEEEFKPGWRWTAARLMLIAEKLQKPYEKGTLVQFAPSAAYELCKPSAPEEALEQAIDEAAAGKKITRSRAKQLVLQQQDEQDAATLEALESLPAEQRKAILAEAEEKAERAQPTHWSRMQTLGEDLAELIKAIPPTPPPRALAHLRQCLELCKRALKG